MGIRVWYVPYAYGINTHMVQKMDIPYEYTHMGRPMHTRIYIWDKILIWDRTTTHACITTRVDTFHKLIEKVTSYVCTRKKYVTYCTTAGDAPVHARYVQFVGVFSLNCTCALDTSAILCTPKDRHAHAFSLARHEEGHPGCRLYLPYRICCTQ